MKYDIRRHLKEDVHSWAIFLLEDVLGTFITDVIKDKTPVSSGLTYSQALSKLHKMNIKEYEEEDAYV